MNINGRKGQAKPKPYKKPDYKKALKHDLPSSLVVFLVALPLCLGISLASGAPLVSGLITGIIGGIVVGLLSGSRFSVAGPAAGLTVIVLNAISDLGSFNIFLTAVVLAGLIQITLGYLKAGVIGMFFPSSVIKGMLAAIGLTLILKQIPHLLGVDVDAFGDFEFFQANGETTLTQIGYAMNHVNMGALMVGIFSVLIMLAWDKPSIKANPITKYIPGPLLAVLFGIILNLVFMAAVPAWTIESSHLVSLPSLTDMESLRQSVYSPDFTALGNPKVWIVAITIAIIASLETLLSIEAVDKLDPAKRRTPKNRELKAHGVGNLLSGLAGGLPLTSVIVRSSANVEAGAKTKMSAVYHGILLLICALAIPGLLNMIPLSALAAVLVLTGYKLTKPALFKKQYKLGMEQFLPFVITVVAILFTDLLIGIGIGMAVGIYYLLRANYKSPYFFHKEEDEDNNHTIRIELSEHVSFLNKASLQLTLEHLPENSNVVIDGSSSRFIDFDALEVINNFSDIAKDKDITLVLKDIPEYRRN